DARERPQRPIPAGQISAGLVWKFGVGVLCLAVAILTTTGIEAGLLGAGLALTIVVYDAFHKGNLPPPLVMGLCRALVYCTSAAAAEGVSLVVIIAGLALLAYVAGITYAARQENFDRVGNLWPLLVLAAPLLVAAPALRLGALAILVYLALI